MGRDSDIYAASAVDEELQEIIDTVISKFKARGPHILQKSINSALAQYITQPDTGLFSTKSSGKERAQQKLEWIVKHPKATFEQLFELIEDLTRPKNTGGKGRNDPSSLKSFLYNELAKQYQLSFNRLGGGSGRYGTGTHFFDKPSELLHAATSTHRIQQQNRAAGKALQDVIRAEHAQAQLELQLEREERQPELDITGDLEMQAMKPAKP